MTRAVATVAAIALGAGLAGATATPPPDDAALVCQDAIESGGHRFARVLLASVERCATQADTSLAACLEAPARRARVDRAAARWQGRAARLCRDVAVHSVLGYLGTCGPASSGCGFESGALDVPGARNDLIDCLRCRIEEAIRTATAALFAGRSSDHPCHRSLGGPGVALVRTTLDEIRSCLDDGDALSIAACLADPARRGALEEATAAWRAEAETSCAGTNAFVALGFPGLCAGVAPPAPPLCPGAAPACNFGATSALSRPGEKNDLLDCLQCQAEEVALALARGLHGAEVCCTADGCRAIRSRASCRGAGGRPFHYRIDAIDVPEVPRVPDVSPPIPGGVFGSHSIALGPDGTVYLSGYDVRLRALRPDGSLAVVGELGSAYGLAIDGSGSLYGALRYEQAAARISPSGEVTRIAGWYDGFDARHSGDGGPARAAQINIPNGIAVDGLENVYLTESGFLALFFGESQPSGEYIRLVDPSGMIRTIAGTGIGGSGGLGGPATAAQLSGPYALGLAAHGRLLIGEVGAQRVLELEPGGNLLPFAGRALGPVGAFSGDGGPAVDARLYGAEGMAEDRDGKVAIADFRNGRVRLVDRFGSIITIAGTGDPVEPEAPNGDGGPGSLAAAGCPAAMAAAPDGRFYYPDLLLDRLRVLTPVAY